jgi:hypothetical protein
MFSCCVDVMGSNLVDLVTIFMEIELSIEEHKVLANFFNS